MSVAQTPQEARAAAWEAHNRAEAAAERNTDAAALLHARRTVAMRYPGCATAILSPDPTKNWDRGRLVTEIAAMVPKMVENGG